MKRRIVKSEALHEFTLRAIHLHFRDQYNESIRLLGFEEHLVPTIERIDLMNSQFKMMPPGKRYLS
jgi:hypothetical protein